MSETFKKDKDKIMVELVLGDFAPALLEVAKVGTMGAIKYSPHGWKENDTEIGEKIERVEDAKGRHRLARQVGIPFDPESKLYHLSHEAWNTLAHLTLYIQEYGYSEGSELEHDEY
jgi:hypothetical protein